MNNYFDLYKSMYENQKKMMNDFKGFMPQSQTSFSPADIMKQYENFMGQQQNLFGNMSKYWEMVPKLTSDPLQAWQEAVSKLNPLELSKTFGVDETQVFEKILDANKFYLSLYNFYDDLRRHYVAPAAEQAEKATKEAQENFEKLFTESMLPLLPNELRPMFENPYNLTKTVIETTTNFFEPWKETMPEMTEALLKTPLSRDELSTYVQLWRENYNQTAGALLKMPAMGLNRSAIEQQARSVDAAAEMLLTTIEYVGQLSQVTSLQGKLSVEDWAKEFQDAAEPKSFKEFYDYWTKKIEDELVKFFYTDEYAQILGKVVEASAKYKIESDKLAERYLENTVIVTKGQIDNLYKTVTELKREVRNLKKELAAKEEKQEKTK